MFKSSRRARRLKRRRFRKRYNRASVARRLRRLRASAAWRRCFNVVLLLSFPSVRAASVRFRRRVVLVSSFPLPERFFMQFSELIALLAQYAQLLPSDAQLSFQQTLDSLSECCQKTEQRRERDEQTLRFIQFALENLRVDAKYLAFDLEATRRENARLNQLLETFLNNER